MFRSTTNTASKPAAGAATGTVMEFTESQRESRLWLLMTADDVGRAQQERRDEGAALLRCGALFGAIQVEAIDFSRTAPVLGAVGSGRGLAAVVAVLRGWRVDLLPWGKRVWAEAGAAR